MEKTETTKSRNNKIYQRIKLINPSCMPTYSTALSACMDCCANLTENVIIAPGKTVGIPLGFALDLSFGTRARLYPRSGLAIKKNITLENAPGTIDADYLDEIIAIVHNDGTEDFVVEPLMKICQIDIERYQRVKFIEVTEMRPKDEEHLGFGSTSPEIFKDDNK